MFLALAAVNALSVKESVGGGEPGDPNQEGLQKR
jgi:hypothetical protein